MRRLLLLTVAVICLGCSGGSPSESPMPRPQTRPVEIPHTVLYRDRASAKSFTGVRVAFVLRSGWYGVEPGKLTISASMQGVSPVLVLNYSGRLEGSPLPSVWVVGVCRGPTFDGVWRTAYADFFVTVEVETITVLPPDRP